MGAVIRPDDSAREQIRLAAAAIVEVLPNLFDKHGVAYVSGLTVSVRAYRNRETGENIPVVNISGRIRISI